MAIRSVRDIPTARFIGLAWMLISLTGAIAVGLVGRAWFTAHATPIDDPEPVFILLGKVLLHPLALGFLLPALLAALMTPISPPLPGTGTSLPTHLHPLSLPPPPGPPPHATPRPTQT